MPKLFAIRTLFIGLPALLLGFNAIAQQGNHLQYVNPLIGTTTSSVLTKWGNNGGTYPGCGCTIRRAAAKPRNPCYRRKRV
jgi:hypothetical protein